MKLIHTRINQLRIQYNKNLVYEFGVFYNTYITSRNKSQDILQYYYQFKDSFSLHLMSLIIDNSLRANHIITLLNYHNCLYYNHTKFGLNHFASYKTSYHNKQSKSILNRIFDIMTWNYKFNYNINFTFKMFKLAINRVYIDTSFFHSKAYTIIDFANQNLINMVYEISQQNKKIERKLTFMVIYNLFLR